MTAFPNLKARVVVQFPASVSGAGGISVTKDNGAYTIGQDFSLLDTVLAGSLTDPSSKQVQVFDPVAGSYSVMTLADLGNALYSATSTTSLAIGTGPKVFTTQSGKDLPVGSFVLAASDADEINYMLGQVTAYSGTTLTVNVSAFGGSGTYADWTIRLSGSSGAATTASLTLEGSTSGTTTVQASAVASGTLTLPAATDTLVGRDTEDTLTNKDLTDPDINGGTADALTSLGIRSTGAAFDLKVASDEVLTADRSLSIDMGDADRNVTLGGDVSLGGSFTISGAFAAAFTLTAATSVTFPTVGTLANQSYVDTAIADLVDSSPTTLDTLNELAAALGDDPNFATTTATALGNRLRFDAAQSLTSGQKTQVQSNAGLVIGTDVQAHDADLDSWAGKTAPTGDAVGTSDTQTLTNKDLTASSNKTYETIGIALSDETTAITTGTNNATLSLPYAFTVTGVYATLNTASSSGAVTVDINEAGTSILSTKLTIDASEKTSATAATAAVISDASIAANAEIGFDIDGAGTGAKGLKVFITGHRT